MSITIPAEPLVRPKFHLIMPTVQLAAMAQLWGASPVIFVKGEGSVSSEPTTVDHRYGRLVTNIQTKAYLNWTWKEGPTPSIRVIYGSYLDRGIPDISIDRIWIRKKMAIDGRETILYLKYGKETVHPQDYRKLVIDGEIPKQELYETITRAKTALAERGLPSEVLKRMRASGLVLHDIEPRPELMYDAAVMLDLWEPGMWFGRETFKMWALWDYEIRSRP